MSHTQTDGETESDIVDIGLSACVHLYVFVHFVNVCTCVRICV